MTTSSSPDAKLGAARQVVHSENLYGALWRSVATEVLAGTDGRAADVDWSSDPVLVGVDRHVRSLESGLPVPRPAPGGQDSDPAVAAYLSELQQRIAHGRLNDDPALVGQLQQQLGDFRLGAAPWEQMQIQYFEYYARYPFHLAGTPEYRSWQSEDAGRGDVDFGVVEWRLPSHARLAVIGDIGTGTDVAACTLVAALSFKPDAILHVGDVYYSGTEYEFTHRYRGLYESVCASAGHRAPVFGVPGNHEYFTGARAYLACLDSGAFQLRPDQRQHASYFALKSEDDGWQFLGMDTSFIGHTMAVPPAAQQAALAVLHRRDADIPLSPQAPGIVDPTPDPEMVSLRPDEVAWHTHHAGSFPGRSILLSHHQLYTAVQAIGRPPATPSGGTQTGRTDLDRPWVDTDLWRQLGPLFGEHVAAWIWGHEHNLGIYADSYRPADWPADLGTDAETFRTLPKGRCCGHAAIPVNVSEHPYATTYPVPLIGADVQLAEVDGWYNRGFEIIDLAGAGRPADVRYFQLGGVDPTPLLVYQEKIT
jgi:hypothetical protein